MKKLNDFTTPAQPSTSSNDDAIFQALLAQKAQRLDEELAHRLFPKTLQTFKLKVQQGIVSLEADIEFLDNLLARMKEDKENKIRELAGLNQEIRGYKNRQDQLKSALRALDEDIEQKQIKHEQLCVEKAKKNGVLDGIIPHEGALSELGEMLEQACVRQKQEQEKAQSAKEKARQTILRKKQEEQQKRQEKEQKKQEKEREKQEKEREKQKKQENKLLDEWDLLIRAGNVDGVKKLLARNPGAFRCFMGQNTTPLFLAAQLGQTEIVACLLQADQESETLCVADTQRWLPLHIAADRGHLAVVNKLLTANPGLLMAQLTAQANTGRTALHIAVENGDAAIVGALCEVDENRETIHLRDGSGAQSALFIAARKGHTEILEQLLAYEPLLELDDTARKKHSIYLRDKHGALPVHAAACLSDPSIMNRLLDLAPETLYEPGPRRLPLIHLAIVDFSHNVLRALLKRNPELAVFSAYHIISPGVLISFLPLDIATITENLEAIDILLTLNPKLAWIAGELHQDLPLHLAIMRGSLEGVKKLLAYAPQTIDAKMADGASPYDCALKHQQEEIANYLDDYKKQMPKEEESLQLRTAILDEKPVEPAEIRGEKLKLVPSAGRFAVSFESLPRTTELRNLLLLRGFFAQSQSTASSSATSSMATPDSL